MMKWAVLRYAVLRRLRSCDVPAAVSEQEPQAGLLHLRQLQEAHPRLYGALYPHRPVDRRCPLQSPASDRIRRQAREPLVKLLIQQNEIGGKRKTAAATKQLEQAQERIAEVSRIIKRLYEDNVNGKISDERFMELSADYEQEQRELKDRAAALQAELDKSQAATVNAEKFMGIVRKHLAFEELTPPSCGK